MKVVCKIDTNELLKIVTLESEDDLDEFFGIIEEYRTTESGLYDRIENILSLVNYPCTIVCEYGYVDKIYRDAFYHYFASKHNRYDRNCKRLSVFKGIISEEDFYQYENESEERLQNSFVGTIVIRPLDVGKIGRTLLDPEKLEMESSDVRLTSFNVVVLGHQLSINAFPYSSQDTETMTCAETTVWSILEYYGTRYPEYKTVLPNEIYDELSRVSNERVWPSKGLSYEKVSDLLKTFGFSPRIYALESYAGAVNKHAFDDCNEYKRVFHYYVESGIPFAVGISADSPEKIGHSMVCIGHTCDKKPLMEIAKEVIDGIPYIDSADYYDSYVMIDDNRSPYILDDYFNMDFYGDAYVDVFAVPLYKRILMESGDARNIVEELLKYDESNFNYFYPKYNELFSGDNTIDEDNPVVVRLMLTSSRKFKSERAKNAKTKAEAAFYANISYPKFLWIAEIATHKAYENNIVYGEIILDATVAVTGSDKDYENSIILIRYFSHVGYSTQSGMIPYEDEDGNRTEIYSTRFENILDELEFEQDFFSESFNMYFNNLKRVGI